MSAFARPGTATFFLVTLNCLLPGARASPPRVTPDILCADSEITNQAVIDCVGRDTYQAAQKAEVAAVNQCIRTEKTQDARVACIENDPAPQRFLDITCPCQVTMVGLLCGENTRAHNAVMALCDLTK